MLCLILCFLFALRWRRAFWEASSFVSVRVLLLFNEFFVVVVVGIFWVRCFCLFAFCACWCACDEGERFEMRRRLFFSRIYLCLMLFFFEVEHFERRRCLLFFRIYLCLMSSCCCWCFCVGCFFVHVLCMLMCLRWSRALWDASSFVVFPYVLLFNDLFLFLVFGRYFLGGRAMK